MYRTILPFPKNVNKVICLQFISSFISSFVFQVLASLKKPELDKNSSLLITTFSVAQAASLSVRRVQEPAIDEEAQGAGLALQPGLCVGAGAGVDSEQPGLDKCCHFRGGRTEQNPLGQIMCQTALR